MNAPDTPELFAALRAAGIAHAANDNIAAVLGDGDIERIEANAATAVRLLLDALVIAPDHNTIGTPERVARMLVHELFRGRYEGPPALTDFPNTRALDELYTLGPVTVRSMCSHHLVPVTGQAWIGVIPGERLIGISKFARLTDWIMSRPQIQEEAVVQLADVIEQAIAPKGLAVVVRATHMCMTARGVCDHGTTMTTSVMRGLLLDGHDARAEFFRLIAGQEF